MGSFFCRPLTHFVATVALAAAMMSATVAPAQERPAPEAAPAAGGDTTEPVLVVTLGSVSKLQQDVQYLSATVGQPQAGGLFLGMSAMFTNGIDTTQPIGVMMPLVDGMPEPIAMVPTKDVTTVLKMVEAQTGGYDELDDGTLVISVAGTVVY